MKLLQLNQLNKELINSLKGSFDGLPHTDHKDGAYRLRRYSAIELRTSFWNAKEEIEIDRLEHRDFLQSEDLNAHQGGMTRAFEDIEHEVLQSEGFKEICLTFKQENDLIDGQEVEVHQMRVVTLEGGTAPVSPEGVHQDGYDHIAMIAIARHNIGGGSLMAYDGKASKPFLTRSLEDGEMIMLNDRILWHNATPIVASNLREQGYGDWFILCARR